MTPAPQFRWLVVTTSQEHWDDRAREYHVHSMKREPKLQCLDGETWRDVPTVEIEEGMSTNDPNRAAITEGAPESVGSGGLKTVQAAIDSLTKNYARYMFLRDSAFLDSHDCRGEFAKLADCNGEEFDKLVDDAMNESRCPECGSHDTHKAHHEGNAAIPETDFKRCDDCGHQWGHQ